jgi:(R,R)-butanediol dehydrogenase/meso-butanediol dehydrogenase/diacetyl reductase
MIGMSCLIAARLAGAEKILVIGSGTGREQLVKKQGADAYVAAKKEDPEEFVKEWTDSKMADVAFECVGLEQTLKTAVRLTRNGGTIMVMGVYEKEPRFPINYFQEGERVLLSSQAYIDEIAAVLDNMSKGLISTSDLITSRISLDRIVEDGFEELLRTRDKHVKILVKIADLE